MLTPRQNLIETIHGGNPDRFVKQFEFLQFAFNPHLANNNECPRGGINVKNGWGVTQSWREDQPGCIPVHTPELTVVKDIEHWQDYVKAPRMDYTEEDWAPYAQEAEKIDRNEYFVSAMIYPGLLEHCNALMGMENSLCAFYENPDEMHDLLEYITEWELKFAEGYCTYIKPDALFHHDDWGSSISTFFPPELFAEFFEEPYRKLYGYYKEHGVKLIVHHSDSYAATLVPSMIRMGIDIWQGPILSNNIPELIKEYGGKISFMGGVNSWDVDKPDWSYENSLEKVESILRQCGKHYFIACNTMGGPGDAYEGVYDATNRAIDECSKRFFDEM